jgi:hypothetical protein
MIERGVWRLGAAGVPSRSNRETGLADYRISRSQIAVMAEATSSNIVQNSVKATSAAALINKTPLIIRTSVRADRCRMAAAIIRAID